MFTRDELKKGLQDHMDRVEESRGNPSGWLTNPEYRTAACLLSIMDAQDGVSTV